MPFIIMRCGNCGWPNKPNETTCVKCHAPLEVEEYSSRPINATVREQEVFGCDNKEENVCPKCGYPIRGNSHNCPNCNYEFAYNCSENHVSEKRRQTRMENPMQDKDVKGTINPYMQSAAPEPGFVLSPIKRINEKKDFVDLEYEGREVILTRDNTEADNSSITSHEQALLSYNNGKWSIEDKSEQGTTFVRASRKIELNNGDVILLGNRLFEFRQSEN